MDPGLFKKLFNLGLYLFIVVHLTMLTIYVLPHEPASNAATGISALYMSQFFHQEWDLFAPLPPNSSLKLAYVGYDENGTALETIYPAEKALEDHLNYRSITATKEVYLNRRYAAYLIEDMELDKATGPDPYSLLVAQHYCRAHALFAEVDPPKSLELVVLRDGEEVFRSERSLINASENE